MFVTDGGLETDLVFHDGVDLPCFAAFPLLDARRHAASALRRYYDGYLDIARSHRRGLRRRVARRGAPTPTGLPGFGYSPDAARRAQPARPIDLAEEVRAAAAADGITAVVSGCVGPRGDGYDLDTR